MHWLVATVNPEMVRQLAGELGLPPLLARLLVLRGIETPTAAEQFLNPRLDQLHAPSLMAGMDSAVLRLRRAIERQEKILVYGDYDVDGTMAVVVLLTALRSLGAKVDAHIPHRLTDGYGMRKAVIEQAGAQSYSVVLSVDTGIREHEVIARAGELGIDCIVTDHHLPDEHLPPACAILNPRRPDCAYPEKNLAGVGVAFKLAQALLVRNGSGASEKMLQSYLKVVAIGTIADVVPLTGENRVIAYFGLQGLQKPVHPGLDALLTVSGLAGKTITAGDIGFRIGPRLNAAGRMENARDVIDLLTTSDPVQARQFAERLEMLNRERQRVETEILREITIYMDQHPDKANCYSLVLSGQGWHRGVIGIVAQRVVERYHRPTLVIGVEEGIGQGSARSIPHFHLLNALSRSSDLFDRFGGHAQAAGFTLPAGRIGDLEARLETYCRSVLKPEDLEPVLRIDAEIKLDEVESGLFAKLCKLEPFGFGNPAPTFVARNVKLMEPPRVLKDKHLKFRVTQGGRSFDALGWGWAGRYSDFKAGQQVDLAFALDENVYMGRSTLQLILKDAQVDGVSRVQCNRTA
ncbi:MAG TPA: single-stranded-DNA-specific exonuclease RecJ [Terriglobia bacterium]|nr:single-stranded-DNA-specific exonuclease RecJ [Terriglobia bacterium]